MVMDPEVATSRTTMGLDRMTMTSAARAGIGGRSRFLVGVVFVVFFVISFLTNILGPLVPDIIAGFHVSLTMAGILPFAFSSRMV